MSRTLASVRHDPERAALARLDDRDRAFLASIINRTLREQPGDQAAGCPDATPDTLPYFRFAFVQASVLAVPVGALTAEGQAALARIQRAYRT